MRLEEYGLCCLLLSRSWSCLPDSPVIGDISREDILEPYDKSDKGVELRFLPRVWGKDGEGRVVSICNIETNGPLPDKGEYQSSRWRLEPIFCFEFPIGTKYIPKIFVVAISPTTLNSTVLIRPWLQHRHKSEGGIHYYSTGQVFSYEAKQR